MPEAQFSSKNTISMLAVIKGYKQLSQGFVDYNQKLIKKRLYKYIIWKLDKFYLLGKYSNQTQFR